MDMLLQPPTPHVLALVLYLALALHFWRSHWRGAALAQPVRGLAWWERTWLAVALLAQGVTLVQALFPAGGAGMHFGFAVALSLITWLAVALYWIESLSARMEGLQMLGLPLAAASSLLPWLFPGQQMIALAEAPLFRIHLLVAMLAYSLFTLAALHAILMAVTERHLHSGRMTPLFAGMPPLLTMETLLFRLIHIAFLLLTLTLASGVLFSEQIFGKALTFNHKTVFAILSWLIFSALLIGRHRYGWRGRTALRWTLAGFILLLLAYVGTRFVLEVILGRTGG